MSVNFKEKPVSIFDFPQTAKVKDTAEVGGYTWDCLENNDIICLWGRIEHETGRLVIVGKGKSESIAPSEQGEQA